MIRTAEPGKTKVGWIGTGVMGASMCGHLLACWLCDDRFQPDRGQARAAARPGCGTRRGSPGRSPRRRTSIFSIVGYPSTSGRSLSVATAALAGARPACDPGRHDHERAGPGGRDRPCSPGRAGRRDRRPGFRWRHRRPRSPAVDHGRGRAAAVAAVRPLFELMGKTIVHQGGPGAGQHTKMVNQILIASGMVGVCEALLYGLPRRAGPDDRPAERVDRRGGFVEPGQPGSPDDRRQLRPRVLRRALPEGHGDRPGRSAADEAGLAGPGAGRAVVSGRRSSRACPVGNPGLDPGASTTFFHRVGNLVRPNLDRPAIEGPPR